MLSVYLVKYKGLYMGGKALVKAENAEEALSLVENDPKTINFNEEATAEKVKGRVLYNDNGDY